MYNILFIESTQCELESRNPRDGSQSKYKIETSTRELTREGKGKTGKTFSLGDKNHH